MISRKVQILAQKAVRYRHFLRFLEGGLVLQSSQTKKKEKTNKTKIHANWQIKWQIKLDVHADTSCSPVGTDSHTQMSGINSQSVN